MDLNDTLTVIADDIVGQALQASLEKKPEVAEALYGVGNAIKRATHGVDIEPNPLQSPWYARLRQAARGRG